MIKIPLSKIFLAIVSIALFISCDNEYKKTTASTPVKDSSIVTLKNQASIAKISEPDRQVIDDFYEAISANNTQKVKKMLTTSFPASFLPKNKITPLQAVIWAGDNLELAKALIEGGANPKHNDNIAILTAAEYKRYEILKYLVKKGSDIKHTGAFNQAGFYQFYDGAKYLLLHGANQTEGDTRGKLWIFHQAVRLSDYEVLNALQMSKDDWNYHDYKGQTALIIAVKNNDVELVKFLIGKGVDKKKPETFDSGDDISFGQSPLQIAKENQASEIITLLQ